MIRSNSFITFVFYFILSVPACFLIDVVVDMIRYSAYHFEVSDLFHIVLGALVSATFITMYWTFKSRRSMTVQKSE